MEPHSFPREGGAVQARVTIVISGRVQGVFFRSYAQKEARRLRLSGFAENMRDGNVRIVAEGSSEALRAFIESVKKGPPLARVETITVEWQKAQGTFDDFHIR
jgi:acylphosphatase